MNALANHITGERNCARIQTSSGPRNFQMVRNRPARKKVCAPLLYTKQEQFTQSVQKRCIWKMKMQHTFCPIHIFTYGPNAL